MLRIILTIGFIPAVLSQDMIMSYVALFIFIAASFSDWLDGYLARKYELISNFGKIMDPLADKILVFSALLCFIQLNIVPAWMVIIIVSRDFLISGMRIIAAQEGKIIMASTSGKIKTLIEMAAILGMLVLICVNATLNYYGHDPGEFRGINIGLYMMSLVPYWLMFIAAAAALISGLEYFFKNTALFRDDI